jgi:hypothetical protein
MIALWLNCILQKSRRSPPNFKNLNRNWLTSLLNNASSWRESGYLFQTMLDVCLLYVSVSIHSIVHQWSLYFHQLTLSFRTAKVCTRGKKNKKIWFCPGSNRGPHACGMRDNQLHHRTCCWRSFWECFAPTQKAIIQQKKELLEWRHDMSRLIMMRKEINCTFITSMDHEWAIEFPIKSSLSLCKSSNSLLVIWSAMLTLNA